MGNDMSDAGNSWTPPKGPFTRQGSRLFRGDGQQIGTAMAANEADWMLKQLNAAVPSPEAAELRARDAAPIVGEREAFEAAFPGRDFGLFGNDAPPLVYNDQLTQFLWRGWQARAALPSGGGAREAAMAETFRVERVNNSGAFWIVDSGGRIVPLQQICDRLNTQHIPSAPAGLTEEEQLLVERVKRDLAIWDDPSHDVMSREAQHAKNRLGYIQNARGFLAIITRLTGGQKL